MNKSNCLREYIKNSELRIFSDKIKVRLSSELAQKYDQGVYQNYLIRLQKELEQLEQLQIKYSSNANPILYVYIVPDNNFPELLQVPAIFAKNKKGCGKPVVCYDLDGFNLAFGLIENITIEKLENELHELSHIILGQFMTGNQVISEGVVETLPLYGLNLETDYLEHQELLLNLEITQIYSIKELIEKSRDRTYGDDALLPNKSCSFRLSYMSSYLFIRGLIETISEKYNSSKKETIQYFLETLRQCSSSYNNEFLIKEIANTLELSQEELLTGKSIQEKALNSILQFSNYKGNKKILKKTKNAKVKCKGVDGVISKTKNILTIMIKNGELPT